MRQAYVEQINTAMLFSKALARVQVPVDKTKTCSHCAHAQRLTSSSPCMGLRRAWFVLLPRSCRWCLSGFTACSVT